MKNDLTPCINTHGYEHVYEGSTAYDPNTEYYMIDFFDREKLTHVRLPFLELKQVFSALGSIAISINSGKQIENLRILPEAFLDTNYVNYEIASEAMEAGIKNAAYLCDSTRKVIFGSRYEENAREIRRRRDTP